MRARRHSVDIGRRLQQLRAALELTQEDVAHRAGMSAKFLSQVENGHSSPSLDVFMRIVELGLDMSMAEFFGGVADEDRDTAAVRSLVARQPAATRRRVLRALRALLGD